MPRRIFKMFSNPKVFAVIIWFCLFQFSLSIEMSLSKVSSKSYIMFGEQAILTLPVVVNQSVTSDLRDQTKEEISNHHEITLSFCLSVFLSFCLSVFLSFCLSVFLSFCLSVFLSFCLSVFLSFCLSVFLSFCLSVFLSFCLSVFLSVCLSVFLSSCLYVFLSFCLSVFLTSLCLLSLLLLLISLTRHQSDHIKGTSAVQQIINF